jgi:hypothetical protein
MMTMKEIDKDKLSEFIGLGIHTYLRKGCESKESGIAWKAILSMPEKEWTGIVDGVAKEVIIGLKKGRFNKTKRKE